jgi:hypothetical protein
VGGAPLEVLRELHKKDYPILWDGHTSTSSVQVLPVFVLLAGKMPAPQEILGYFFSWKSLKVKQFWTLNLFPEYIRGLQTFLNFRFKI